LRSARRVGVVNETLEGFEFRVGLNRAGEDKSAIGPEQETNAVKTRIRGNARAENFGALTSLSLGVLKRENAEEVDGSDGGKEDCPKPETLSVAVLHNVTWPSFTDCA
jgi:hypothetical protein